MSYTNSPIDVFRSESVAKSPELSRDLETAVWSSQDLVETPSSGPVSSLELLWARAARMTVAASTLVERIDVIGHVGQREWPLQISLHGERHRLSPMVVRRLLQSRAWSIDVLECPRCKASPMRILAAIHPPTTTRATLKSPGLPTRAPPIAPARPAPLPLDWSLAETEAPA